MINHSPPYLLVENQLEVLKYVVTMRQHLTSCERVRFIGPMPQPTAICIGMCSVWASPGRDKQENVLAALASVWALVS